MLALACALALVGCAPRAGEVAQACPPARTPPVGPEAIDKVLDDAMADMVARRTVSDPEARSAARRQVVRSCLENVASTQPVKLSLNQAAAAVTEACAAVIDRFVQAEAADATFRGAEPPSLEAMTANRSAFHAEAAQLLADLRAGRCL